MKLDINKTFLGPKRGAFLFSIDLFGDVRKRGVPEAFERAAYKHRVFPNVYIDDAYSNGKQAAYLWIEGDRELVIAAFREFAEEFGLPHREILS